MYLINNVARADDYATLEENWKQTKEKSSALLITAPFGGGKRAIVAELCRSIQNEHEYAVICRPNFMEEEQGEGAVIKLYTELFRSIHAQDGLRGALELQLNMKLASYEKRTQDWIRNFIDSLKKGAPKGDGEKREFQVSVPGNNPLIAYVELLSAISMHFPVLLDLQNIHNLQSLPLFAMVELLLHNSGKEGSNMLTVLQMLPLEDNRAWLSLPLQDILKRREESLAELKLQAWSSNEVAEYLKGQERSEEHAEKIADITSGRPGFIAELVDWLKEDEDFASRLPETTLENIIDFAPTEELSEEEEPPLEGNKPAKCTAENASDIAYVAALLGLTFPSRLIANMTNFDLNSVDDLIDASEHVYTEGEPKRSKPLDSWIYRFRRAIYRESILSQRTEEKDKKAAANVGQFMERNLSQMGYGYLVKAMRVYNTATAYQRCSVIRNMLLNASKPQYWAYARDIFNVYSDHDWPDAMVQVTLLQLCERMSKSGNPEEGERLIQEGLQWARSKEDKITRAAILSSGADLDRRRQDVLRARERAQEALNIYRSVENSEAQQGMTLNKLALIELQDKKYNAAMDKIREAEKTAAIPPVQAMCRFIEGSIQAQGRKKENFEKAATFFHESNRLAGQSGNAMLALESGMKLGEVLLNSQQPAKAADVIQQVAMMANRLQAPVQERLCHAMLAQAQGGLKNFESALKASQRALKITQDLKLTGLEAFDTFQVGRFNMELKNPTEAVALFKHARSKLPAQANPNFLKELLFSLAGAQIQIGELRSGEETLREALSPAKMTNDQQRLMAAHFEIARLAKNRGDKKDAKTQFNLALAIAEKSKNAEFRRRIKDELKQLR